MVVHCEGCMYSSSMLQLASYSLAAHTGRLVAAAWQLLFTEWTALHPSSKTGLESSRALLPLAEQSLAGHSAFVGLVQQLSKMSHQPEAKNLDRSRLLELRAQPIASIPGLSMAMEARSTQRPADFHATYWLERMRRSRHSACFRVARK